MIRAKLVLRNVIGKPLRSAIIILSLAAAAFAALFCISGINSAKNGLTDFFRSNFGDADIMALSAKDSLSLEQQDLPAGSKIVYETFTTIKKTQPDKNYINYINKTDISFIGIDTQTAFEMRMFDRAYPTDGGITITEAVASQFNKNVGDTFVVYGHGDKEFKLKILDIVPATRFLRGRPFTIISTPALCNDVAGNDKDDFQVAYIDIPGDTTDGAVDSLRGKYSNYQFIATYSSDSDESLDSMMNIYYLIFAVVFLMVCFIVVSMSKHIVNERMSVIGMLRSIGGSISGTGALLLAESAFYGLCGGILGTLIFLPLKDSLNIGFLTGEGIESHSDGINIVSITLVIIAVILIQCLFSAAAILKAAKTPVRDIIFGTKETAYKPSKVIAVIGAALFVISIIIHIVSDEFTLTVLSAFVSAIGIVLLFPMLISLLSKLLASVFDRLNMPVAKLAVKEMSTTKSCVSSAQLILSAISLTIAMLIIAVSLLMFLAKPYYNSEIVITTPEMEGKQYRYLQGNVDGIEDVECIYYKNLMYDSIAELNGEPRDIMLIGFNDGGFRYLDGINGCPNGIGADEAYIDAMLASKLSLGIGDDINIKVDQDKYIPGEFKLKIKGFIDSGYFNSNYNSILINLDTYKSVYYDNPSVVLIKTTPGRNFEVLSFLRTTLPDNSQYIITGEEFQIMMEENMSSILSIVYAIIVLGFALSLLGTSSNILMGFEQSRRKYAVYYSSSMSKDKLKKLILVENMLLCGISVICALIFGMYFLNITETALRQINMGFPMVEPLMYAVLFGALSFVVLMAVVIKPIKMLSKMNIAEEIKTSAD